MVKYGLNQFDLANVLYQVFGMGSFVLLILVMGVEYGISISKHVLVLAPIFLLMGLVRLLEFLARMAKFGIL